MTPPGYQLVPVEPTAEMLEAARDWSVKKYGIGVGNDAATQCYQSLLAAAPQPPAEAGEVAFGLALHPSTVKLVKTFARALAEKLAAAELKYGYQDSWLHSNWETDCRAHLYEHLAKGDPRDVANYCAFMWHHGWSTASPAEAAYGPQSVGFTGQKDLDLIGELMAEKGMEWAPTVRAAIRLYQLVHKCTMNGGEFALFKDGRKWPYAGPFLSDECETCGGTGKYFIGFSGREDDGNAQLFEPCDDCNGSGQNQPLPADPTTPPAPAKPMLRAEDVAAVLREELNCWADANHNRGVGEQSVRQIANAIADLLPPDHRAAFVERAGG